MNGLVFNTIDEYNASFEDPIHSKLWEIHHIIAEMCPEATEHISYGIPTFKYYGNLVHYAGNKNHIGFHPGGGIREKFEAAKEFQTGKGTLQFAIDKPLPNQLISDIVRYCRSRNEEAYELKLNNK